MISAVEAVQHVANITNLHVGAGATPEPLTQMRFEAMMQASHQSVGAALPTQYGELVAPHSGGGSNTITSLVQQQDAMFDSVLGRASALPEQIQTMNLDQIVGTSVSLQMELCVTQINFETKMALVNSSKGSVETLMKNQ